MDDESNHFCQSVIGLADHILEMFGLNCHFDVERFYGAGLVHRGLVGSNEQRSNDKRILLKRPLSYQPSSVRCEYVPGSLIFGEYSKLQWYLGIIKIEMLVASKGYKTSVFEVCLFSL